MASAEAVVAAARISRVAGKNGPWMTWNCDVETKRAWEKVIIKKSTKMPQTNGQRQYMPFVWHGVRITRTVMKRA
jgi:hypothetical protein